MPDQDNLNEECMMTDTAYRLLTAHRRIDDAIQAEQSHRLPDPWRLQRLKKLKLATKDRLLRMAQGRVYGRQGMRLA
jgi:uncharacterized protein